MCFRQGKNAFFKQQFGLIQKGLAFILNLKD